MVASTRIRRPPAYDKAAVIDPNRATPYAGMLQQGRRHHDGKQPVGRGAIEPSANSGRQLEDHIAIVHGDYLSVATGEGFDEEEAFPPSISTRTEVRKTI